MTKDELYERGRMGSYIPPYKFSNDRSSFMRSFSLSPSQGEGCQHILQAPRGRHWRSWEAGSAADHRLATIRTFASLHRVRLVHKKHEPVEAGRVFFPSALASLRDRLDHRIHLRACTPFNESQTEAELWPRAVTNREASVVHEDRPFA